MRRLPDLYLKTNALLSQYASHPLPFPSAWPICKRPHRIHVSFLQLPWHPGLSSQAFILYANSTPLDECR